jgi:hypothetical protein
LGHLPVTGRIWVRMIRQAVLAQLSVGREVIISTSLLPKS